MTGHPRPRQPYQQGQGQQGQQGQQGHANPYFLLPGPTPTSTTAPMLSSDFNHSSELVWDELVRHPQLLVQQQGQPLAQPHVQPQPQPTPLSHNHNQSNRDNHSKHSQPHSQPHSQQKQQQQQQVASVTALAAGSAHATTGTTAPSAGSGTSPTSKDEAGAVDRSQSDSPGHEHQSPSRSLWVGNIDSSLGQGDLLSVFSAFGTIESIRMLPERECAFINYARLEDAVAGRQQMQGGRVGHCIVRIGYGKVDATHENPAMLPTKSLWIGNISPTTTPLELERVFSAYGAVESARVLSHKNCGFVNFVSLEDAITARTGLNGKDVGGSTVKIGYAKVPPPKTESAAASSSALGSTGASGASAGLTGSSGLLGHAASAPISPSALAMTLPSPSMHLDAVVPLALGTATAGFPYPTAASSPWNGPMQPGSGIGPSPTFSPARFAPSMTTAHTSPTMLVEAAPRTPSAAMLPSVFADSLATPADSPNHVHGHHYHHHHHHHHQHHQQQHHQHQQQARGGMPYFPDDMYSMTIPPIPEPSPNRRVDQSRLREIRKKLEGHPPQRDIELIFHEIIEDSPELCADYIGNVVIQKIVERCNDQNRQVLIEKVAPYLAALGIHKNGTWAVQKIIDCARTPGQAQAVIQGIRPYTPPLLLDQFGNYVVQCCLRLGINHNQFIFDAMAAKCWELGQGRFGARAMRACLESQYTVKRQQKQVSIAIVQHAPQLAMNPNGAILVTWLMDMSTLPGRYRVLAPAMLPHLTSLCTHKLASTCVLKLVNQRFELDARDAVLNELFNNPANLAHVLSDPVHGVAVVQKILASGCASTDERMRLADATRRVLLRIHDSPDNQPGYKRLMEELSVIPSGQHSTQMSGAALDGARIDDVVSPLTPHAPFFSTSQSTPGSGSGPAAATATGGANPSPMRQPSAPLFMDEPVATASSALYAGGAPSATSAGYGHYVGGQDHIPTPSQSPPPQLLQSAVLQSALSSAASSSHMQHVSFLGPPSNSGMYAHAMQQMHVHQQHQYFQQQQQQQIHQAAMNVASMSFAQQAQFQQQTAAQQQQQQHGVHQPPSQAPFMSPYARQPTQDQGGYFAPMLGLANTSAMGGSPLHAFPQAGQHPGNGAGVNSGSDNPVFRPSFNDGTAGY
ncbi:hypothetical protein BC831DRAFT_441253 [Entophlyctis helioformis]|nr:hypothetical protein BC831DRAFT_441253 [Entophlyctis helioformis]